MFYIGNHLKQTISSDQKKMNFYVEILFEKMENHCPNFDKWTSREYKTCATNGQTFPIQLYCLSWNCMNLKIGHNICKILIFSRGKSENMHLNNLQCTTLKTLPFNEFLMQKIGSKC
jgi:hypothetical protein